MKENPIVEEFRATLPPFFKRTQVEALTGGILNAKTLANLDSQGLGPERFRVGRLVAYEKESFLLWLQARMAVERR